MLSDALPSSVVARVAASARNSDRSAGDRDEIPLVTIDDILPSHVALGSVLAAESGMEPPVGVPLQSHVGGPYDGTATETDADFRITTVFFVPSDFNQRLNPSNVIRTTPPIRSCPF